MAVSPRIGPSSSGPGNALKKLGSIASRTFETNQMSRANPAKIINIKVTPLLPAIIAIAALLYNYGMQSTQPNKKQLSTTMMATEAGLASWAAINTGGVFPLAGLGLAAYRAGKEQTALGKTQAVISTLATLGLGYIGVHLFSGFSEGASKIEDEAFLKLLQGEHVENEGIPRWIARLAKTPSATATDTEKEIHAFGKSLQSLQSKLEEQDKFYTLPKDKRPEYSELKKLRAKISELKTEAWTKWNKLNGEAAIKPLSNETPKGYQRLHALLQHSQQFYIKSSRKLNPVFGYIIVGLMGGAAMTRMINKLLSKNYPNMKTKNLQLKLFGNENLLLPNNIPYTSGSAGNAHGGGQAPVSPAAAPAGH